MPPVIQAVGAGAIALSLLVARGAVAQTGCPGRAVFAEVFSGSAWSLPLPLTIDGPGVQQRAIAHYATRPFADAPYYSYRAGVANSRGSAVELEMLHHKLYLQNPTPPVERLEISHGYNLPMINAVGPGHGWEGRIGIGLVVAHPEGRIGDRDIQGAPTFLGGGYHIAGISTQLAIGRRYPFGTGRTQLYAAPEVKLTASWARVSVDSLTLLVPNIALHALGGLGARQCE